MCSRCGVSAAGPYIRPRLSRAETFTALKPHHGSLLCRLTSYQLKKQLEINLIQPDSLNEISGGILEISRRVCPSGWLRARSFTCRACFWSFLSALLIFFLCEGINVRALYCFKIPERKPPVQALKGARHKICLQILLSFQALRTFSGI